MTKALVVYCHPLEESFVATVRDRVVAALAAGGAEVRLTVPIDPPEAGAGRG